MVTCVSAQHLYLSLTSFSAIFSPVCSCFETPLTLNGFYKHSSQKLLIDFTPHVKFSQTSKLMFEYIQLLMPTVDSFDNFVH